MQFESIVMSDETIAKIYNNLTDYTNCIWRRDVKEVKAIDDKHFIEYSKKGYPTFFTVLKKTKNKKYELEFTNNKVEGTISYDFSKVEEKTKLEVCLNLQWTDAKVSILSKTRLKKNWKYFLQDLEKVGI